MLVYADGACCIFAIASFLLGIVISMFSSLTSLAVRLTIDVLPMHLLSCVDLSIVARRQVTVLTASLMLAGYGVFVFSVFAADLQHIISKGLTKCDHHPANCASWSQRLCHIKVHLVSTCNDGL